MAGSVLLLGLLLAGAPLLRADLSPDQTAALLLDSARRAYNEKSYTFAAARFREFLARFGNHPQAPAARYGLALTLLEGPTHDYNAAADLLQPLAGDGRFPERPFALYYLGAARRGQGLKELAHAKPQDLAQRRNAARPRFEEAARHFEAAAREFAGRKGQTGAGEWAARARCDQAEMLLRLDRPKEARAATAGFLDDPALARSRYRGQGRYYHGSACFLLSDFAAARRALSLLEPFDDPVFGTHARFLLADCLLRLTPRSPPGPKRDQMEQQLRKAVALLDGLIAARPPVPQTPDALLKLGECYQRLAGLLNKSADRTDALASARSTYERFMMQFPNHALRPEAVLERARCLAQSGDRDAAERELRRFAADPLKKTPAAPRALLQLAFLLAEQHRPAEAAKVLEDCRREHEPVLLRDPANAGLVLRLQYHQAMNLRAAGKFAEARNVLDNLVRQFPNRPETAEAILRRGQCLKDEALAQLTAARKQLARPDLTPQELAAARGQRDAGYRGLQAAVQHLTDQANQLRQKPQAREVRARLLYEAAWGCRELGEVEVAIARERRQQELWNKLQEEARKKPNSPPPAPPEVPLASIPLQPSEGRARALYRALAEDKDLAGLPLLWDARLELAELHAGRGEFDTALKLLKEDLGRKPAAEVADRIHICMGKCLAARKDLPGALAELDRVAGNRRSPLAGRAQYLAGEYLLARREYRPAARRLEEFRDEQPFRDLPGLTDRALLRLGHAYEHLGEWEKARQTQELLVAQFPSSPWLLEARYGIARAWQNQGEHDRAVSCYQQITTASDAEIAGRAQLQIGLCRLQQKRYGEAALALLVVPFAYERYPELSAAALCEAARALAADGKPRQASALLRRVLRHHPRSPWAGVAKERLEKLTGQPAAKP